MTGSRSRSGCWTCRSKSAKKRCDQQRPSCGRCSRLELTCDYLPRPTLKERRRAQEPKALAQVRAPSDSNAVVSLSKSPQAPMLSSVGSCSLALTNVEHEAIRYFRTDFARLHHTKHPGFSLISLMFKLAEDSPMIMHMVVALGLQESNSRRQHPSSSSEQQSLMHYSSALRMLSDGLASTDTTKDLDGLLTALWLMLLYEQQFGDAGCKAYSSHLQGVASLIHLRGKKLLEPPDAADTISQLSLTSSRGSESGDIQFSMYAARMLVWIALLDAAAASSGVGGQVNAAIFSLLLSASGEEVKSGRDPVKAFSALHRHTNPLYRNTWGDSYPQSELLDDVENRNIYSLLGQCAVLRFMVAQLATLHRTCSEEAATKSKVIEASILEVGELFRDLIDVANELAMATDNTHRLVANIRAIVPFYHAVVLDFMRVTSFNAPLGERQRSALKCIMNLAYQSYKHGGDEALARVAWPLFLAVLETDDMLHRDWILDRFQALGKYGKNYERAYRFLVDTVPRQQHAGRRIDMRVQMAQLELFVLS